MEFLGSVNLPDDLINLKTIPSDFAWRVPGSYISCEVASGSGSGTGVLVTGVLRANPLILTRAEVVSRIWSNCATLLAGATHRIGVYNSGSDGYPTTLIAGTDVQAYDDSTAGDKEGIFAAPITLPPGQYWLAWQTSSSATMALRTHSANNLRSIAGSNINGAANTMTHIQVNNTYGAMPATFPSGAALQQAANSAVLKILLRRN